MFRGEIVKKNIIEAMLFVAGQPLSIKTIAVTLEISNKDAEKYVLELKKEYEKNNRGVNILKLENGYQMCSNPKYHEYIKKANEIPKKPELSETLLETLAIVAYRQPVTRYDIEDIRGVSASFAINKLMDYGLICEKGRLEQPGKPILFGTTDEFLKHFGITTLEELPKNAVGNIEA